MRKSETSFLNRKTPKQRSKRIFVKRKTKGRFDPRNGQRLHGVKNTGNKSQKKVSRVFGGFFSSKTTRKVLKSSVRSFEKEIIEGDNE